MEGTETLVVVCDWIGDIESRSQMFELEILRRLIGMGEMGLFW